MSFRLKSLSDLYKNLGAYDAIVELTEIAILDFIANGSRVSSFNQFLILKSAEHKIKVNSIQMDVFRSRISQGYILSVYQSAEAFFYDFKGQIEELTGEKILIDNTNDDFLTRLIRKISTHKEVTEVVGEFRLSLFNYYRIIRNKYSHDRIEESKVKDVYKKLSKYKDEIRAEYPNLSAPNEFENVSFDDFILFSRVVKDIANGLNQLAKPSLETIAAYYTRANVVKKYKDNSKRKTNALRAHINDKFGLDGAELEQVIEILSR